MLYRCYLPFSIDRSNPYSWIKRAQHLPNFQGLFPANSIPTTHVGPPPFELRGQIYLLGLYWAISTVTTTGYGDLVPGTYAELVVCICIMLVGAGVVTFAIASLISVVQTTDKLEAEKLAQYRPLLNRYP